MKKILIIILLVSSCCYADNTPLPDLTSQESLSNLNDKLRNDTIRLNSLNSRVLTLENATPTVNVSNLTPVTDDTTLIGNGGALTLTTIPNCTSGALQYTQSTNALSCGTIYTPTQANASGAATTLVSGAEKVIATRDKTITSGNTVLLLASGYCNTETGSDTTTLRLKYGSTAAETYAVTSMNNTSYSMIAIVTGLSGSTTFSVTATHGTSNTINVYAKLIIIEF